MPATNSFLLTSHSNFRIIQGGPSAPGKDYVDIKFKVLSYYSTNGNFKFGVNSVNIMFSQSTWATPVQWLPTWSQKSH